MAISRLHCIRAVVLRGCRAAAHCHRVCYLWIFERAPRELFVACSRCCFSPRGDGQGAAAADEGRHCVCFRDFCGPVRVLDDVRSRQSIARL